MEFDNSLNDKMQHHLYLTLYFFSLILSINFLGYRLPTDFVYETFLFHEARGIGKLGNRK